MKSKKSKKSILIIGLGKFGRYLALKMQELGNQVMVVDKRKQKVKNLQLKLMIYLLETVQMKRF
uniref:NAD-binding protein n=1 Tax=Lactococcus sp. TaxID=44273 RepID=UPI003368325F